MPAAAPYFFIKSWSVVRQQNVVVRWNGERVEAYRHLKEHVIERYRQRSMKTFLRKDILLNYPWRYAPPGPPSSAAVARESSPSRTSDHRDPLPGAPPAG